MIKKILFLALFSMFALSACEGNGNTSEYIDDCDENMADCQQDDSGSFDGTEGE
jgi:hypothetical protein